MSIAWLLPLLLAADDPRALVERALAEHAKTYAGWRKHVPPPRPTLAPLGLPLTFLEECLSANATCPGDSVLYFDAALANPDPRAVDVAFAHAQREKWPSPLWPGFVQRAPLERALELAQVDVHRRRGTESLAFAIALGRAGELDQPGRAVLITLLAPGVEAPANGKTQLWGALLTLDPARFRDELARSAAASKFEPIYHWELLTRFPAPTSPLVNEALRGWLPRIKPENGWSVHRALLANLRDDAVPLLRPRLEELIAQGRLDSSALPFGDTDLFGPRAVTPTHAAPRLIDWKFAVARDRRLPAWQRAQFIGTLPRKDPRFAELLGWWAKNEGNDEHLARWRNLE